MGLLVAPSHQLLDSMLNKTAKPSRGQASLNSCSGLAASDRLCDLKLSAKLNLSEPWFFAEKWKHQWLPRRDCCENLAGPVPGRG